jgi:hypothetical protein
MTEHPNLARARRLLHSATQLIALARDLENEAMAGKSFTAQFEPSDGVLVELARQIYDARRKRSILHNWADLFGEPAWDILLDLFIAAHDGRHVSVTSACLASGAPPSTALRWLQLLEEKGLVVRENDLRDARRKHVRISAIGFSEFNRYLRCIADGHSAFVLLGPQGREEDWGTSSRTSTEAAATQAGQGR